MQGTRSEVMVGAFVFLSVLYMIKSVAGIDLVANCHADQVLIGACPTEQIASQSINLMNTSDFVDFSVNN